MFGEKPGRDAELQGGLMGHPCDLTSTDDAKAIWSGEVRWHGPNSSRRVTVRVWSTGYVR
jgi:hypothetical protein